MTRLYIDFETWSSVSVRRGTDVYLDNAKPLLMTYAVDDGSIFVCDFSENGSIHAFAQQKLQDPSVELWAHNAVFDRNVLRKCFGIETDIKRWRCSLALALSHSLPGGLGPLCDVLQVPTDFAKIKDSKRLIQKFCCKKEFVKDEEWEKFIQYAVNDIAAMRECVGRMPNWNYHGEELALYHLDQVINDRGFRIDRNLATGAVKALAKQKTVSDDWTNQATGGAVTAATQRDKLLFYICEKQGCFLPDLKAATIKEALQDENLDESTRELLKVRLDASKTSGSKYKRLLDSVGKEDRLRYTLQYAGASRTARWAGRIFQPQNLPRPTMAKEYTRQCIDLVSSGQSDIASLFAPINEVCSNALRGLIVAAPGKTLFSADFSAIEGRVNAWIAGETWKVKAFRDGQDLYKLIYSKAFGVPVESITKRQRQIGKVQELALGYGGGVGAFLNMAAAYGMDLEELGRTVQPVEKALEAWERALTNNETFGLTKEVYVACDTLKIGYRKGNPAIVQSWYQYEDAVRKVIDSPNGQKVQIGRLVFDCNGSWLRINLPSGRFICYAQPRIHKSGRISYMGWRNKKWSRTETYGGKFDENIVQAISRDIFGHALLRVERQGFPVVLHVHDEVNSEVPRTANFEQFLAAITEVPAWAKGLPINVEGFQGERYEK